jgi:Asp-tRNA(Asn)/Glu-tRNA(Gln) amidotransferase C subunit
MSERNDTEASIATVERLAALARIAIPADRKEALATEFDSVRAYIAQLDELTLPTDGAPALPALHNVLRDDANAYAPSTWTQEIVSAFPAKAGNALTVKKIISHD